MKLSGFASPGEVNKVEINSPLKLSGHKLSKHLLSNLKASKRFYPTIPYDAKYILESFSYSFL